MKTMVRLFTFFGNSNTGKTTVILELAKKLQEKGYKVSYMKNTDRDHFDLDPKDKDTGRLNESRVVLGRANLEFFMRMRTKERLKIEDILSIPMVRSCDFLLIEGNHDFPTPKILFLRECGEFSRLDDMTVGVFSRNEMVRSMAEKKGLIAFDEERMDDMIEFVERSSIPPLPNMNCKLCGYSCGEMAKLMALGRKRMEDCKILSSRKVDVRINGRRMNLVPFLEDILRDVILGVLRNLKGYEERGDVEVRIRR